MGKLLRLIVWLAVLGGIVVGAARAVAIRWWRVPSDDLVLSASVRPTLAGGDLVLLWRATKPHIGSLVVCPDPEDPTYSIVGRLVAREGQHVVVDGSDLIVDGDRAPTESACDRFTTVDPNTENDVEQHCDTEVVGGVSHMRGTAGPADPSRFKTERDVGPGKVFLVSDNRMYPFDSRQYGNVDVATCTESVFFRLVSGEGYSDFENRLTYIQ